ncbi:DMT family transporter [Actibacterium sp. MT2.3-13A]|uniref:DMT family transporter n=1 Tax=Actibacterium sp. MT2.3-13A TaxID=2828332 RepID=UPI002012D519|nr:DMT family transporter [Actibacterium sp. MT2.3-13A]
MTALTMVAFAANSILNRAALAEGAIGPGSFAALRLASGAVMLGLLLALRDRRLPRPGAPNLGAVAGLAGYMLGFSYAYVALDAGLGALILFGGVQMTMFLGVLAAGEALPPRRWAGAGLAFGGLVLLLWPAGAGAPPALGAALMAFAAASWGVYSLVGRAVADPLHATGANFLYALPAAVALALALPDATQASAPGILLAVISGAVTSGLGYAMWYSLLPRLGVSVAAVAQLSAPVLAVAAGVLLLGEPLRLRALLAAGLVLGGVALGVVRPRQRTIGSSGS